MAKKQVFNGVIDEFVNWSDGYSDKEGKNISGYDDHNNPLPISGGAIRRLLQERLRTPVVMKADKEAGLYRVFSSEAAYKAWEQDPENFSGLELFNFPRPSDFNITVTGLPNETKYLIEGLHDESITRLSYNVWCGNESRESMEDITIIYKVTNANGATHVFSGSSDSSHRHIEIDVYDYLDLGENNILISLKGVESGASQEKQITINQLVFNLSADFNYYVGGFNGGTTTDARPLQFNCYLSRNLASTAATLEWFIDDVQQPNGEFQAGVLNSEYQITIPVSVLKTLAPSTLNNENESMDNEHVWHTLQFRAKASYDQKDFYSNIIYYTFEIKSDDVINNMFINPYIDFPSNSRAFPILREHLYITADQYLPATFNWAYYTDTIGTYDKIQVNWKLYENNTYTELTSVTVSKGTKTDPLTFIPIIFTAEQTSYKPETSSTRLVAEYVNGQNKTEIFSIPIFIKKSAYSIIEKSGYDLKLSAYGKTNSSATKTSWDPIFAESYSQEQIDAINFDFHNVKWDDNSGWFNNSFRVSGINSYCEIGYDAFGNDNVGYSTQEECTSLTIEFEFESEKISDTSDVLMTIGVPYEENEQHEPIVNTTRIEVTPNKATLYDQSGTPIIYTNYKANERVKLAFVINKYNPQSINSSLAFIVTDGILERAARSETLYNSGKFIDENNNIINDSKIVIGKSNSGIRLYNLRVYKGIACSYDDLYGNFVFDSDDKLSIINRNNVLTESKEIDYNLCKSRLDTILISGDLSKLLDLSVDKNASETDVTIERFCPFDTTRNFKVEGCKIRKHGQSTLNYPIASMKFWLNKSTHDDVTPKFTWEGAPANTLAKNRYVMRAATSTTPASIPANKFVLQANYADSSGVHNGTFLRIINDTWYNAQFDLDNNKVAYRLRTEPQLFSTNQTVTLDDGTVMGINEDGYNWDECTTSSNGTHYKFPYNIRISPDSFPCVVFYKDTSGSDTVTFLGQYVFMDDKKSDFNWGERSIYNLPYDPFCMTVDNKDADDSNNRIWNNKNVLRIEVINIDNVFTSYMSTVDDDGIPFDAPLPNVNNGIYRWEQDFEVIYPDPDDLGGHTIGYDPNKGKTYNTDTTKFGADSDFRKQTQSFVDWFKWLVATRNSYNVKTNWWNAGTYSSGAEAFRATAAQHLDLYKMAAYYCIMLRCGLVDSGERNVQIKTYDGVHFHYEPWDMDIALGNQNTGGIVFDPPIDRDTKLGSAWAISGRSADADTGELKTSNWLWDSLEAWPRFMNEIVPEVSEAMYKAGFTYNNLVNLFDNEYSAKWCEIIYNKSGYFKYIQSGGADHQYLPWLQGARINHRHWWLSTSMDYYDAKWTCGEFKSHFIYIAAGHVPAPAGTDVIYAYPSCPTFLTLIQNDGEIIDTSIINNLDDEEEQIQDNTSKVSLAKPCSRNTPADFDISTISFSNKVPTKILGATYIEKLDVSCLARRINLLNLAGAYSSVNGASLKEINVGCAITPVENDPYHYTGTYNNTYTLSIQTAPNNDNLENIQSINIRGQIGKYGYPANITASSLMTGAAAQTGHTQMKNLYAMGSNLGYFESAPSGNEFETLELPAVNKVFNESTNSYDQISSLTSLTFNNTSWENISFWNGTIENNVMNYERANVNNNFNYYIPTTITQISLLGSSANSANAKDLIFNWIHGIMEETRLNTINNTPQNDGESNEDYNVRLESAINSAINNDLAQRKLKLTGLNWSSDTCGPDYSLTYDDLLLLAKLNGGKNKGDDTGGYTYQGYVLITPTQETSKLDTIQLSNLKSMFGDGIFDLTSGGLIIDQQTEDTTINLGGDTYTGENENHETVFYLREVPLTKGATGNKKYANGQGGRAQLSATKFRLRTSNNEYLWQISAPNAGEGSNKYRGCEIIHYDDGSNYLIAKESFYGDYQVKLSVSIQVQYEENGVIVSRLATKTQLVNIVGATYPTTFDMYKNNSIGINETNDGYLFSNSSAKCEFYIAANPEDIYSATIKDVKYTLTRLADNQILINEESYKSYIPSSTTPTGTIDLANDEVWLAKVYENSKSYGMTLKIKSYVPETLDMYYYRLTAKIYFMSDFVPVGNGQTAQYMTVTKDIIVLKDDIAILSGSRLFRLMQLYYEEHTGKQLGTLYMQRYHLLDVGDTIDFGRKFEYNNIENTQIDNLRTSTGESILKYLAKVKNVSFNVNPIVDVNDENYDANDESTWVYVDAQQFKMYDNELIGTTAEQKLQFDFSNMINLETAEFENCSHLTDTVQLTFGNESVNQSSNSIDFTNNTKLKKLNLRGTEINPILGICPLEELHLGTPTSVVLNNITTLDKSKVSCDDPEHIEDIQIVNCGNNESFGIFGKIMGVE